MASQRVEGVAAEVDKGVKLVGHAVASVDNVHHVGSQHEGAAVASNDRIEYEEQS